MALRESGNFSFKTECNMILANVTGIKFSIESIDEYGIRTSLKLKLKFSNIFSCVTK
jgi:hypothetical protein